MQKIAGEPEKRLSVNSQGLPLPTVETGKPKAAGQFSANIRALSPRTPKPSLAKASPVG